MGADIYKLVDGKPVLSGYIKSKEEIDAETVAKIREQYSTEDELKIHRLAIADPQLQEFIDYVNYVNTCRAEGEQKLADARTQLASLEQVELQEGEFTRKIFVEPEG